MTAPADRRDVTPLWLLWTLATVAISIGAAITGSVSLWIYESREISALSGDGRNRAAYVKRQKEEQHEADKGSTIGRAGHRRISISHTHDYKSCMGDGRADITKVYAQHPHRVITAKKTTKAVRNNDCEVGQLNAADLKVTAEGAMHACGSEVLQHGTAHKAGTGEGLPLSKEHERPQIRYPRSRLHAALQASERPKHGASTNRGLSLQEIVRRPLRPIEEGTDVSIQTSNALSGNLETRRLPFVRSGIPAEGSKERSRTDSLGNGRMGNAQGAATLEANEMQIIQASSAQSYGEARTTTALTALPPLCDSCTPAVPEIRSGDLVLANDNYHWTARPVRRSVIDERVMEATWSTFAPVLSDVSVQSKNSARSATVAFVFVRMTSPIYYNKLLPMAPPPTDLAAGDHVYSNSAHTLFWVVPNGEGFSPGLGTTESTFTLYHTVVECGDMQQYDPCIDRSAYVLDPPLDAPAPYDDFTEFPDDGVQRIEIQCFVLRAAEIAGRSESVSVLVDGEVAKTVPVAAGETLISFTSPLLQYNGHPDGQRWRDGTMQHSMSLRGADWSHQCSYSGTVRSEP